MMLLFLLGCKVENPLEGQSYVRCTYKYTVVQKWPENTDGSEFVDTLYADLHNYSLIFRDDYDTYYLLGYKDGELIFSKTYIESEFLFGECELFTGDCVGTTKFYENGVLDGTLMFWSPPNENSVDLYSEFPFTSDMLDLQTGLRVWNVFEFEIIR